MPTVTEARSDGTWQGIAPRSLDLAHTLSRCLRDQNCSIPVGKPFFSV
jgi:hypothetical protein